MDDFDGETYAPTACKSIVWLVFAVAVLLNLCWRWYDITGAFMAERPQRDIYVTLDGKFYKLMFSLYGLDDAPRLFNEGLVQHLTLGRYIQSKWDSCLFIKWTSPKSYVFLVFHVNDFTVVGTDESVIDAFEDHLKLKYDV